ncbi:MAG: iron(III) transport system permease protein [Rhodospirillaceae bacterium]|nr:MAG: iron(III) transport system permease protein [Rhodospirillaceae bacterium]
MTRRSTSMPVPDLRPWSGPWHQGWFRYGGILFGAAVRLFVITAFVCHRGWHSVFKMDLEWQPGPADQTTERTPMRKRRGRFPHPDRLYLCRRQRLPGRALGGQPGLILNVWTVGSLGATIIVLLSVYSAFVLALFPTENIWPHLLDPVLPGYIPTTLSLMVWVCIGTFIIGTGTGTAWLVGMCQFPGRRISRVGIADPSRHAGLRHRPRLYRPAGILGSGVVYAARRLRLVYVKELLILRDQIPGRGDSDDGSGALQLRLFAVQICLS